RRSTAGGRGARSAPWPGPVAQAVAHGGHPAGAATDPDAGAQPDPVRRSTDRHTTGSAAPRSAPCPAGAARPGHRVGSAARARRLTALGARRAPPMKVLSATLEDG